MLLLPILPHACVPCLCDCASVLDPDIDSWTEAPLSPLVYFAEALTPLIISCPGGLHCSLQLLDGVFSQLSGLSQNHEPLSCLTTSMISIWRWLLPCAISFSPRAQAHLCQPMLGLLYIRPHRSLYFVMNLFWEISCVP